MALSQAYELGNDGEMRLMLGLGGPPRAGRITALLGGNRYTVEIADSENSAVTASALNGAVYASGDVVYLLQAENAPDSGVIIGRIGAVAALGVGTATPSVALDVVGDGTISGDLAVGEVLSVTGAAEVGGRFKARSGILTTQPTMADDTVLVVATGYPEGFLLIHCGNQGGVYALITFRANGGPWCIAMANSAIPVVVGTGALTDGTADGTDGALNVSAQTGGSLVIKNRLGGSRRFDVLLVA